MQSEIQNEEWFETFCAQGLIDDVLFQLKSGKEATVYCCKACPSTCKNLLAAKVYRDSHHRNFSNDAAYREGRYLVKVRVRHAVEKNTDFGKLVKQHLWVGKEFETLKTLWQAGTDVPKPYDMGGNAILMEFVGCDNTPAPLLRDMILEKQKAEKIFDRIIDNIEVFLANNIVHADLSPFNILYDSGKICIIDFPQAVDPRFNRNAFDFLKRDVENICKFFGKFGVEANSTDISTDLWTRFMYGRL